MNANAKTFVIHHANEETQLNAAIPSTHNSSPIIPNYEVLYQHCIKFTEKKVQYENGSRNVFVHQLACNCSKLKEYQLLNRQAQMNKAGIYSVVRVF
ncbi:MAG: hypothetical protein WCO37_12400 [Bacteroidota bacterium]